MSWVLWEIGVLVKSTTGHLVLTGGEQHWKYNCPTSKITSTLRTTIIIHSILTMFRRWWYYFNRVNNFLRPSPTIGIIKLDGICKDIKWLPSAKQNNLLTDSRRMTAVLPHLRFQVAIATLHSDLQKKQDDKRIAPWPWKIHCMYLKTYTWSPNKNF